MARCKGFSKLSIWRTTDWSPHSYQGASASIRRKLWCLGRAILDVRLCSEGSKKEGGSI
jgi:hypothetical protein